MAFEIAVQRQVLGTELKRVQSVIPKKPVIPVLECVHIQAIDQSIILRATDLETTIHSTVESKLLSVIVPGEMYVPAKRLIDIVSKMKDGRIKLTQDANNWIHVIGQGSRFKIPSLAGAQFVELPSHEGLEWFEISSKSLKTMMKCVKGSITSEDDLNKKTMRGSLFEITGNGALMVSTDGHRLSLASCTLPALSLDNFQVIIPAAILDELSTLLSDYVGSVGIATSPTSMFFRAAGRILIARQFVGKFPNYSMPFQAMGSFTNVVTLDSTLAIQSIDRALLLADKEQFEIKLTFADNSLKMAASTAEYGESNEEMEIEYAGPPLTIWFNGKFLIDFLQGAGDGSVRCEIKDSTTQMYMIAERDETKLYYCVMPLIGH